MSIYNLGGGGGAPVLEQRTVTPTTSQQIIKPTRDEYDGLSQVTVEATPLEARTVNPSKYTSTIFPSDPNIGFSSVTVNGANLQSKTLTPSTLPYMITPDASYLGLAQATVQKPNTLVAGNIKSGVNIFGVNGSYTGSPTLIQAQYISPSGSATYMLTFSVPSSIPVSTIFAFYLGCIPQGGSQSPGDFFDADYVSRSTPGDASMPTVFQPIPVDGNRYERQWIPAYVNMGSGGDVNRTVYVTASNNMIRIEIPSGFNIQFRASSTYNLYAWAY